MADEKGWMDLFVKEVQLTQLLESNKRTEQYGLVISEEDARLLMQERKYALKTERRVEFGEGILSKIIDEFCDSAYLDQSNYVDTLIRLQEIFFLYKNEMMDEITDGELLHFMKEQWENCCFGDLDYLEGTCLEIFAEAVRAGYRDYEGTEGYGEYAQFDIVKRWDKELYLKVLNELFWG